MRQPCYGVACDPWFAVRIDPMVPEGYIEARDDGKILRRQWVGCWVGCPYCDGSGEQPGPANGVGYVGAPRTCPNCRGTGAVVPERSVF